MTLTFSIRTFFKLAKKNNSFTSHHDYLDTAQIVLPGATGSAWLETAINGEMKISSSRDRNLLMNS